MSFWSWLSDLFGGHHPSIPTPIPPPQPSLKAVGVVVTGLSGVKVTLDNKPAPFVGVTDQYGYCGFPEVPVGLGASHLDLETSGYKPYSVHVDLLSTNCDLIVQGTEPLPSPKPNQIILPPLEKLIVRPSIGQVVNVKANFCGMKDSKGRVMFDPFILSLPENEQDEWLDLKRKAGLTHIVLAPKYDYPGSPIPGADFYSHPSDFKLQVSKLLDKGFIPIIMLSENPDQFTKQVPTILDAIRSEQKFMWLIPAWEAVGPGADFTSKQYSDALKSLKASCPDCLMGVHLQPTRATFASFPVEPDDPWHGDEVGAWKSNGGELADGFFYQTQHGSDIISTDVWQDRWIEVVDRLGAGNHTWRPVHLYFFEVVAYDYYKGNCDEATVTQKATEAKSIADKYNVTIGFGNGLPKG